MGPRKLSKKLEHFMRWRESEGREGRYVSFSHARLRCADFQGLDLNAIPLRSTHTFGKHTPTTIGFPPNTMLRTSFHHADLREANFFETQLTMANFEEADLSYAQMALANLSGAILCRANLSGANLERANLTDADLHGVVLYGADLTNAIFSDSTILPTWETFKTYYDLVLPELLTVGIRNLREFEKYFAKSNEVHWSSNHVMCLAFGVESLSEISTLYMPRVIQFRQLYDANLLKGKLCIT